MLKDRRSRGRADVVCAEYRLVRKLITDAEELARKQQPIMRFQKGNSNSANGNGSGRPPGSRNKLVQAGLGGSCWPIGRRAARLQSR